MLIYILLIIYLFVACWQDDLESRPDIQYVEETLMKMIPGSNTIDKKELIIDSSNQEQQKNENSNNFGTSNIIDLIQAKFDNIVKNFDHRKSSESYMNNNI